MSIGVLIPVYSLATGVYSLNAPVPGEVSRIASELHPLLAGFDRVREQHSLVVKRLGDTESVHHLGERIRGALTGTPAFEVRVDGIELFETPTKGSAPVIYLRVDSPELLSVHERLVREFSPVAGLEADDYVPHVTLARGGDIDEARRLTERTIEPVTWTVTELSLWDARYGVSPGTIRLPVR